MAYQGKGLGVSEKFLRNISEVVCEGLTPNITIIFDMDIKKALKRTSIRKSNNRYEKFDINFHTKIEKYFKTLAKKGDKYFYGKCR